MLYKPRVLLSYRKILRIDGVKPKIMASLSFVFVLACFELAYTFFISKALSADIGKDELIYLAFFLMTLLFVRLYVNFIQVYYSKLISALIANKVMKLLCLDKNTDPAKIKHSLPNIVIEKSQEVANRFITPVHLMITSLVTIFAILSYVMITEIKIAIGFGFFVPIFMFLSVISAKLIRPRSYMLKAHIEDLYENISRVAHNIEIFRTVPSVHNYFGRTLDLDISKRKVQAEIDILMLLPRQFIEPLVVLTIVYLISLNSDETMAQFAFALAVAVRILPAFQQLFFSYGQMKASLPIVDEFVDMASGNMPGVKSYESLDEISYSFSDGIFGGKLLWAQHKISLYLGSKIVLVGQSGSGKTTYLRSLALLNNSCPKIVRSDNGDILDQQSITGIFSYTPQDYVTLERTSRDELALYDDIDFAKLERYLSGLGLEHLINSAVELSTLSGGQRQRFLVALSLSRDTTFKLFDEPTSGLDKNNAKIISRYIGESEACCVVVTHSPDYFEGFDIVDLDDKK